ncbi:2OG-Fe(II) oxygenase family protein [Paenibacillus lemnae]|uniref:ATP-binding protein n=1 Tax=Paenibacillus lemnae TaxID=1330551 RepID=A0A848M3V5_PAELE|nr:2OG-Fe(II) oxygenase family protein [Paenibacillus lemnae]NMO94921.1 hypothetical protein [Paenibacillus lemnae]
MNINEMEGKPMLTQTQFLHPSVNIRFDLGRDEFLDRYLPTPSHAESLKGIIKGFLNKGSHAHIMIGSYGSGKSLLTTIIAGIVSKTIEHKSYSNLLSRFISVDENRETSDYLEAVYNQPITYIPVVLNGNQGSFRKNLMIALYQTLEEHGFDYSMSSVALEIESTIELWKNEYVGAYESFLSSLDETSWNLEQFLLCVKSYDMKAIGWFKEVYTQLTNGSKLSLAYERDIVTQLEFVLQELKSKGYGLFIVYDEFGRFMQTLEKKETHEAMHDLQELAELANKDDAQNLHVLFISHRNMRQYAMKYQNEDLEKEFQKIEERFSQYYTLTDHSTFVRLANSITSQYRIGRDYEEYVSELRRFNLFDELTFYEVENLVIKGAYPLHPVTLFVMTHLANQVAQNERTLFTFLESDELGGLVYQYQKDKDWYRVDSLFDYFEPSIGDFEKESLVGHSYALFQRLQKKLHTLDTRANELKVLKLLSLWNIAGLNVKQLPTEELIAFALSWSIEDVSLVMKSLSEKKVVRLNHRDGYWELFEGSSIDTEFEINQRIKKLILSNRDRMTLLGETLLQRFILSKDYNDMRSMTRFAAVQPVLYSEIINNEITIEQLKTLSDSDAVILLVVNKSHTTEKEIMALRNLCKDEERAIVTVSKLTESEINDLINKLSVVKQLQKDQYFLSQDSYLHDELERMYTDLVYALNSRLDLESLFTEGYWLYNGENIEIGSSVELNKYLSGVFHQVYSETPIFRNEAFNRRSVSKIQRNSAIQVVNRLLKSNGDINFDGNGPDAFIYKTIIMNTGINCDNPDSIANPQLRKLRDEVLAVLAKRKGKLEELIDVFICKPFGIRRPLIPLLLVSLFKQEWKHIMFYNKGVFNSEVNGELIYLMIENPEDYTFTYHPYEKKYQVLVNKVEEIYMGFIETSERVLHPAVYTNKILLRWLRSLPRLTQNTNNLSDSAKRFRTLIRRGEIEPDECLAELFQMYKKNDSCFIELKNECETFSQKHSNDICSKILLSTNTSSYVDLKEWASKKPSVVKVKNDLVKSILDSSSEGWVEDLCKKLIGVNRENWSDATDQLFMSQIESYLNNLSEESYQSYIEVKLGEEALAVPQVQLSDKSQLILNNLKQDVKLMGRTVPKEEIQSLLLQLLKEFVLDS